MSNSRQQTNNEAQPPHTSSTIEILRKLDPARLRTGVYIDTGMIELKSAMRDIDREMQARVLAMKSPALQFMDDFRNDLAICNRAVGPATDLRPIIAQIKAEDEAAARQSVSPFSYVFK